MLTVVAPSDLQLSDSQIDVDLASVGFYVPPYMGPPSSPAHCVVNVVELTVKRGSRNSCGAADAPNREVLYSHLQQKILQDL